MTVRGQIRGFRDFGDTCTDSNPTLRQPLCSMRSDRKERRRRRRELERQEDQHLPSRGYLDQSELRDKQRAGEVLFAGFWLYH